MENATNQTQPAETNIRRDIHQHVTDTIIRQLEAGTVPWRKPWKGGNSYPFALPQNATTGRKYNGINIVLLWGAAIDHNYPTQEWASFKQWQNKKEFVRKGEKGTTIVYCDTFEKEVDGEIKEVPFLKASTVFNRCQLASYVAERNTPEPLNKPLYETIYPLEEFIENTEVIIEHNDHEACYLRLSDKIHMPHIESFIETENCPGIEAYYATLLHELTHWTGNPKRLDRQFGKKFGDAEYAVEELTAELGAAFLCAEFEIHTARTEVHAAYIASWLKVLKENNHCVFTAASEASKAVNYLHGLQPES